MYVPHRVWHATNYLSQNASKHRPTHGFDSIEVPNLQQCVHHAQALPTIGFTQTDDNLMPHPVDSLALIGA